MQTPDGTAVFLRLLSLNVAYLCCLFMRNWPGKGKEWRNCNKKEEVSVVWHVSWVKGLNLFYFQSSGRSSVMTEVSWSLLPLKSLSCVSVTSSSGIQLAAWVTWGPAHDSGGNSYTHNCLTLLCLMNQVSKRKTCSTAHQERLTYFCSVIITSYTHTFQFLCFSESFLGSR